MFSIKNIKHFFLRYMLRRVYATYFKPNGACASLLMNSAFDEETGTWTRLTQKKKKNVTRSRFGKMYAFTQPTWCARKQRCRIFPKQTVPPLGTPAYLSGSQPERTFKIVRTSTMFAVRVYSLSPMPCSEIFLHISVCMCSFN